MALSRKFTFIDIFNSIGDSHHPDEHQLKCIEIPMIQRDYAQGRDLADVNRIRKRFLNSLYDALTGIAQPIILDFIYGDVNSKGKLVPLDGQQRLTTLFLLHWYIAHHEHVSCDEIDFLHNFSYATRHSAREFCRHLVRHTPDFSEEILSNDITDQCWMPVDWQHDPTISSMLNMLDAIHCKFHETAGLWAKLKGGAISFYFLPINDMGLTDELYIKMNSRGKPLTEFEHFKAEWERRIRELDSNVSNEISHKIDTVWTDILWPLHDESGIVDNEFVKYFRFLCDVIRFKNGQLRGDEDLFDLSEQMFGTDNQHALDNVQWIEKGFDCWRGVDIPELFDKYLSTGSYEAGKCVINGYKMSDGSITTNMFEVCCRDYGEWSSKHNRKFPIGRSILLYAFVFYLMNKDLVSESDFSRRLRMIVNLVKVSEFELREREDSVKRIFAQIEQIILTGDVDCSNDAGGFNLNQRIEEHDKVIWLAMHPTDAEAMFKLEDHPLMWGAIRSVGIENVKYVGRVYSLFDCDRALVDRALLTMGDYSMRVRDRYQFGSSGVDTTWRLIFRNKQELIGPTRNALVALLEKEDAFDDAKLKLIINQYLALPGQFDWRRYLIKYDTMHLQRYGMYRWKNGGEKNSYEFLAMWTEKNITGRNWNVFLKALYEKIKVMHPDVSIHLGEFAYAHDGDKIELTFADRLLSFEEAAIKIYSRAPGIDGASDTFNELESIVIPQQGGIDTEDRVELAYNKVVEMITQMRRTQGLILQAES